MKNDGLTDLIASLFEKIEDIGGNPINFQIRRDSAKKIVSLLSSELSQYFTVVGEHSSGSLVCYWKYDDGISLERSPLVWLDSEGTPNSVIASNERDFLSLLPYGLEGIYDFISSWRFYNSKPDSYISPLQKYDSAALSELIAMCRQESMDYDSLIPWLNQSLGVERCEDPVRLIGKAIDRHPDLETWLKGKGVR